MKTYLLLASCVFVAVPAQAVSFDCSKAKTYVEKTICGDPLLGKLDDALSKNYKGMLAADFGGSKESLKKDQLEWIGNRNKCTTVACLVEAYRERVDETCDYGVVSGVHPECTMSSEIE